MRDSLDNHCTLKGGTGFPESLQGRREGDIPFIKVSDMSLPGNEKFITTANNYVDEAVAYRIGATVFPPTATVFAKVGAALLLNRRRRLTTPTIIDNNMMAAIPTTADPEFLYHYLCSVDFGNYVQSGALPSVNQSTLGEIPFPRLIPDEQQRVANILSAADEAIEQTEAIIAKTQQIKAGLMHDLFTRGVTPDGHLRPPREQAPQLYKQSPLGWIPTEWDSATLNDVVSPSRPIVYGILMPGRGHPGGIPVIKVKDIIDGEIQGNRLLFTSPQIDAEYQRSKVRPRDILLTIRGTVGRLAQVPTHLDGANITQDTARIGIAAGSPEFYRYYLETNVPRRHFGVNTLGQAVQGINLRDVRTTPVPVFADDEQMKIAQIVIAAVRSERTEREQLTKLAQAKQGLMQDLLSGRVPVAASAEPSVAEVAANA
jgi:type I restriction enzyme, S subunit